MKGFPRTHWERFFRSIPQPGLFFPPRLQPGEYGNGECGMAVQPPSQVGCDSPRNWAGEPIRPRRCWHKLSQEELGQSTDQRGGASPTRLGAQWGKGLGLSKRKTNLFSLHPLINVGVALTDPLPRESRVPSSLGPPCCLTLCRAPLPLSSPAFGF